MRVTVSAEVEGVMIDVSIDQPDPSPDPASPPDGVLRDTSQGLVERAAAALIRTLDATPRPVHNDTPPW